MNHTVDITINGHTLRVPASWTVAAAIWNSASIVPTRFSPTPRAALCAMGTCFECRVTIDGCPGERACMRTCTQGMSITTDGAPA